MGGDQGRARNRVQIAQLKKIQLMCWTSLITTDFSNVDAVHRLADFPSWPPSSLSRGLVLASCLTHAFISGGRHPERPVTVNAVMVD